MELAAQEGDEETGARGAWRSTARSTRRCTRELRAKEIAAFGDADASPLSGAAESAGRLAGRDRSDGADACRRHRRGDRRDLADRVSTALEYAIFRAALGFFALSAPPRRARGRRAGSASCSTTSPRPQRRIALYNLRLAFPDKSEAERRAILRRSCRNLGRVAAEFCHLASLTPESVGRTSRSTTRSAGAPALAAAAERGALILTGHFGNFELLAYAHGLLGHPITLVHRPMRNPLVDRTITGLRARAGTTSLAKKSGRQGGAARAARRAAWSPSPPTRTRPAATACSSTCSACRPRRRRAPRASPCSAGRRWCRCSCCARASRDRHRIVVLPEVELVRSGDREADVVTNTQRCIAVIEDMLRRYPDQWIWFHKRWKTRPLGEARIY